MFNEKNIKSLNDLELSLYKYIIKNCDKVIYMRIRELADVAHVSTTTILRFCKKLNCNGYSEFKVKLKLYLQGNEPKRLNNDLPAIVNCFNQLSNDEITDKINSICSLINSSANLVFLGSGNSGVLCKYAARYFSAVGKFASYIDDPYFPTNYKAYANCVIVVLSVSGETDSIINLVSNFKKENCSIVSITNSESSTLSKMSDLNISYYMQVQKIGISDITTQLPVLYLIETIAKTLHDTTLKIN